MTTYRESTVVGVSPLSTWKLKISIKKQLGTKIVANRINILVNSAVRWKNRKKEWKEQLNKTNEWNKEINKLLYSLRSQGDERKIERKKEWKKELKEKNERNKEIKK